MRFVEGNTCHDELGGSFELNYDAKKNGKHCFRRMCCCEPNASAAFSEMVGNVVFVTLRNTLASSV